MIITVTMNPAIDKTVEIDALIPGGLHRIQRVEYDAGGKGINVSKTLRALGGESIATGFLGGNAGRMIEQVLRDEGIRTDFVWVDGETRTNTKVFEKNGAVTELNEPGSVIAQEQKLDLLKKLEDYAAKDVLFVLSGSVPKGMDAGIYAEITQLVHVKGAKVLLDADGELFRRSLEAVPDMIKPNHVELADYAALGEKTTEAEILRVAKELTASGIDTVMVSRGKLGAMMVRSEQMLSAPALPVNAHSTVGAGDAMVAALAYACERKLDMEECMRLCMAASAGAVTTIGTKPPARTLVDELMKQVEIKR
ncbi:MAG: 1-phosphofructokinase [Eubacteriales bacterium]|nr:1-phosphofructokinase [Eubacteriales bacterium]